MKLKNTAITITLFLLLFSGCSKDDRITIGGTFTGGVGSYLYLNRIDIDTPVFIDSVKISKQGTFHTRFNYSQPAFYNIGFDNSDYITLIAYPGDIININCPGKTLYENFVIEGSPESVDLKELDARLAKTIASLDSLQSIYESLPESNTERRAEIEDRYTGLIKAQRMHNIGYIIENLNTFSAIKALFQRINDNAYVLYKPTDAQYLKLVSDTLNKYYPESKQARNLTQNLEKELSALNLSRISDMLVDSEATDLDIELRDLSGKSRKLSSLKGKNYVLLSFWSAGNEDCIRNNLQLKEYYNRYQSKGFEIYQVNLDENEEVWRAAIAYDELPWISVRDSDTAKISSAIQYNVTRLPANYLIDMNGEIIGKDLFGRNLQIKLSQLFINWTTGTTYILPLTFTSG